MTLVAIHSLSLFPHLFLGWWMLVVAPPWTNLVDLVWELPGHELINVCDAYREQLGTGTDQDIFALIFGCCVWRKPSMSM